MDISYNLSGSVGPSHYVSSPCFVEHFDDQLARVNVDLLIRTVLPSFPDIPEEAQKQILVFFGLLPEK